jgi:hypothetical protein
LSPLAASTVQVCPPSLTVGEQSVVRHDTPSVRILPGGDGDGDD